MVPSSLTGIDYVVVHKVVTYNDIGSVSVVGEWCMNSLSHRLSEIKYYSYIKSLLCVVILYKESTVPIMWLI